MLDFISFVSPSSSKSTTRQTIHYLHCMSGSSHTKRAIRDYLPQERVSPTSSAPAHLHPFILRPSTHPSTNSSQLQVPERSSEQARSKETVSRGEGQGKDAPCVCAKKEHARERQSVRRGREGVVSERVDRVREGVTGSGSENSQPSAPSV